MGGEGGEVLAAPAAELDALVGAVADDVAAREDKRRDTSARVDKETLASLRALEKEIEADAWMYAKPRSTVR